MNTRLERTLWTGALLACLLPAALSAQQPGDPAPGDVIVVGPGGPGGPMGQTRKLVAQFDKDGDQRLNGEERKAAREFIKKNPIRGGPGGPMMFGGGNFLNKPVLDQADADKDGKLTREELIAGTRKLFAECDKDKKGSLDEPQLAEALGRLLPRPQFRGGPGRPPGGPGAPPPPGPGGPGGGPGAPPGGPGTPPPVPPAPGGPQGNFVVFGPGGFLAGGIVRRADANKDSKVTLEELLAAAESLFKDVDKDKDGKLDDPELSAAAGLLQPERMVFGPGRMNREPAKPGPRVKPDDVNSHPKAALYEPTVLRTLFLEFENGDWEAELADFKGTDVEVPATLTVDGKRYSGVGVHFRGMSSYGMVPAGYKRSLNLSLDFVDDKQRLYGHKTLNLLNAHEDPSMMSTVLYSQIARQYIPAPKANFVKLVINGESWGVYVNVQQFDRDFLSENFKSTKGARWKVGAGGGGLDYLGENLEDYKRRYEIKSPDNEKDWKALMELCRTLHQMPKEKLEEALQPILNVDSLLWFLALDVALINNDGYWARGSDYCIYRDGKGKFHIIPHDMNEAFHAAMGFGFGPGGPGMRGPGGQPGGGRGGRGGAPPGGPQGPGGPPPGGPGMVRGPGLELDPLASMDEARKPLRSKILAVPSLKARYLTCVRTVAEQSLDWKKLGPVVAQYRELIRKEVEADTRKLESFEAFQRTTADEAAPTSSPRGRELPLRSFADQRRAFLLNHAEIKGLRSPADAASTGEAKKGGDE